MDNKQTKKISSKIERYIAKDFDNCVKNVMQMTECDDKIDFKNYLVSETEGCRDYNDIINKKWASDGRGKIEKHPVSFTPTGPYTKVHLQSIFMVGFLCSGIMRRNVDLGRSITSMVGKGNKIFDNNNPFCAALDWITADNIEKRIIIQGEGKTGKKNGWGGLSSQLLIFNNFVNNLKALQLVYGTGLYYEEELGIHDLSRAILETKHKNIYDIQYVQAEVLRNNTNGKVLEINLTKKSRDQNGLIEIYLKNDRQLLKPRLEFVDIWSWLVYNYRNWSKLSIKSQNSEVLSVFRDFNQLFSNNNNRLGNFFDFLKIDIAQVSSKIISKYNNFLSSLIRSLYRYAFDFDYYTSSSIKTRNKNTYSEEFALTTSDYLLSNTQRIQKIQYEDKPIIWAMGKARCKSFQSTNRDDVPASFNGAEKFGIILEESDLLRFYGIDMVMANRAKDFIVRYLILEAKKAQIDENGFIILNNSLWRKTRKDGRGKETYLIPNPFDLSIKLITLTKRKFKLIINMKYLDKFYENGGIESFISDKATREIIYAKIINFAEIYELGYNFDDLFEKNQDGHGILRDTIGGEKSKIKIKKQIIKRTMDSDFEVITTNKLLKIEGMECFCSKEDFSNKLELTILNPELSILNEYGESIYENTPIPSNLLYHMKWTEYGPVSPKFRDYIDDPMKKKHNLKLIQVLKRKSFYELMRTGNKNLLTPEHLKLINKNIKWDKKTGFKNSFYETLKLIKAPTTPEGYVIFHPSEQKIPYNVVKNSNNLNLKLCEIGLAGKPIIPDILSSDGIGELIWVKFGDYFFDMFRGTTYLMKKEQSHRFYNLLGIPSYYITPDESYRESNFNYCLQMENPIPIFSKLDYFIYKAMRVEALKKLKTITQGINSLYFQCLLKFNMFDLYTGTATIKVPKELSLLYSQNKYTTNNYRKMFNNAVLNSNIYIKDRIDEVWNNYEKDILSYMDKKSSQFCERHWILQSLIRSECIEDILQIIESFTSLDQYIPLYLKVPNSIYYIAIITDPSNEYYGFPVKYDKKGNIDMEKGVKYRFLKVNDVHEPIMLNNLPSSIGSIIKINSKLCIKTKIKQEQTTGTYLSKIPLSLKNLVGYQLFEQKRAFYRVFFKLKEKNKINFC